MDENPGLSDQYRMASPWPLFVALGLPIAEIGLLFGSIPLSVGGTILFGGSIAGMLGESGYVETAWRGLGIIGVLAIGFGVALVFADPLTPVGVALRGYATVGAGLLLLLAAFAGEVFVHRADVPV